MSMQYLSKLYMWVRHLYMSSTVWEYEQAWEFSTIMSKFSNTRFMWRDCEVYIG